MHIFFFSFLCTNTWNRGKAPTDLKDLGKVCVPVGEHCINAVDSILCLARGASLSFALQYW